MRISLIKAREILDSRGNPTVEVELTAGEYKVIAAVPSGASTGKYEAWELRDGGKRYDGKGVLRAVENVNKIIAPKLKGMDPAKQREIDEIMVEMDGTDNKKRLGANAILGVSMAVCRAGAVSHGIPLYRYVAMIANNKKMSLPVPFCNIINGGKHADNDLTVQEFMVVPVKSKSFREGIRACSEIYHRLKQDIHKRYGKGTTNVGDEGGFAPEEFNLVREPLNFINKSIDGAGYKNKVKIGIDAAASEFYKNGRYYIDRRIMNKNELIEFYKKIVESYPIISIEDPFSQDDFDGFAELTKEIGKNVQIVGDDLLVTNTERIKKAIGKMACNALLLKVNQIGTVTEAIDAARLAMDNGWKVMVSHRSGETSDDFIADLAVGLGAGQIKSGAPCRGERLAKYNRLLKIEEELGTTSKYAGKMFKL